MSWTEDETEFSQNSLEADFYSTTIYKNNAHGSEKYEYLNARDLRTFTGEQSPVEIAIWKKRK
jgi:hypothetical protein